MGRRHLGIVLVLALLPTLPGCGGSCGMTLPTGRSIDASSDTIYLSASRVGQDTSKINLGGKTVVVEPKRIIVEGVEVATIDESARKVSVLRSQGEIVVIADGKTAYDSKIK
jgi:hypothetical protein